MTSKYETFAATPEMLSILEHSDRAVLVMDAQCRILWFNAQAARNMGRYYGEELRSGYTFWDYADRTSGKSFIRNFNQALQGHRISVERRVETKKGADNWIDGTFSPLRSTDGTITGVIYSFKDISQLKQQERERQQQQNIIRAIDNNESQAFALIDAENRMVNCNRLASSLICSRASAHNDVLQRVDPSWHEKFEGGLRVARTGGTVVLDFERTGKNSCIVEIRFCPANAKDEASMVSLWAVDITDKKRAEHELRMSEENLRSVFNSSAQIFYLLDRELNILAFNEAAEHLIQEQYGRKLELGTNVADITPPDRMPQFLAETSRAFTGRKVQVEKHFSNNGRAYWFERHINPIHNKDGVIDRIALWSIDITNRKRAEEALRKNEARFRQLAAILPVGIYQTDANRNTVYVNDSIRNIIPVSMSDLLSGKWTSQIHPDDKARVQTEWARAAKEQTSYQLEYRLLDGKGAVKHVLEQAIAIFNHQKEYTGHLGSLIDLSAQRAHQLLQQEKDVAERSLKFRSDFLASMSHEIRTPLTGILAISELLLESGLKDAHREQVLNIHNASEDLRSIVNDVLHLSELEAGKVVIKEDVFPVVELLNTLIKRFRPEAQAKGVGLSVNDHGHFDPLCTDRRRVTQILSNLIRNAIKFTQEGDVRIVVAPTADHLRFEVHDTGIGIPEHDLPKLFKEFSQLNHTTAQNLEGTGLGLSITRKLADMLGGKVGAQSTVGKGSVFWLELPLKTAETQEKSPSSSTTGKIDGDFKGQRVLLVEDNMINQQAFKVILSKMGCHVTAVSDGIQAVETFTPGQYDLVFMDIQMPVMDGKEAASLIRAKGGNTPIIGLSGNVVERDGHGHLKADMDDLLVKPVTSQDLKRMVKQWGRK
ncbi:MAG: PAS domain S-box protein [Flavobacteriales bacterium]|nr:PAS domain S-box protein [Flavobacteriales bacterium]